MEVTLHLTEILTIAEDSRLEGRRTGLDPDQIIEAAGTLRRIVHRLSSIAIARLSRPQMTLPSDLEAARAPYEAILRDHLQSWLHILQEGSDPQSQTFAVARQAAKDLDAALRAFEHRFATSPARLAETLPTADRTLVLSEMDAYRRLGVLVGELDHHLMHIPVAVGDAHR